MDGFVALSQGSFFVLVSFVIRQWSDRYSDVLQFNVFRAELTSVKIISRIVP